VNATSAPAPIGPDRRNLLTLAAGAILLALFWWLATSAARHHSQTSDELPHIAAGYVYDKFGDYRMHAENGNLPQRLFGLAPLALDAKFPMDREFWENSVYWQLGWDFLYGLDNPTDEIVARARAINALLAVGLGAFIFSVAWRWHGRAGGLLALGFYALCPNFLAHGALATSDIAGALFLTLASWFFWRHLERRDLTSGLIAALASGLALVAKFNGILIAPIFAILGAVDALGRSGNGKQVARLGGNILLAVAQAAGAAVVIWAFFGFRYSAQGAGTPPILHFAWPWDDMLHSLGWKAPIVRAAIATHVMPEGWLYGLTNVLAGADARPAFLAGDYNLHGWPQFFPTVFIAKTPLAMLVALLIALVLAWLRWRQGGDAARCDWLRLAPLAVPALVVGLTAVASSLNIGHRHILAVYPVLFVAVGGLFRLRGKWLVLPCVLLASQAWASFAIRPYYLSFFNSVAGGPETAYRLVTDSSLDWGQDLPALRDWIDANRRPGEKFYLSYFGSAWPPHYGVRPTIFLPAINIARPPFHPYTFEPGIYAVSATSLSEVYSGYSGPWTPALQARYEKLPADSEGFDRLRFSRLCKYLQHRRPDAEPGYSILVFRLTAPEIDEALHGPAGGWHAPEIGR
jgi:4-amino-4-deoxy-L-arabinose transferase-like glycosyltransferase